MKNNAPGLLLPLDKVVNAADLGYLIIEESGVVVDMNQKLQKDLSYDDVEADNLSILEIWPTLTFLNWKNRWKKCLDGKIIEEQSEFITREGVIYPVLIRSFFLNDGGQSFCCMTVSNQLDKKRYRDLLSLTTKLGKAFTWEIDLVKQRVFLFGHFHQYLGTDGARKQFFTQKLIIKKLRERLSPQDFTKLINAIKRTIEFKKPLKLSVDVLLDNGLRCPIRLEGLSYHLEEQTAKIYGIGQDISSFKMSNNEMELSKITLDQAQEIIFWVRADGSFYFYNERACERLGFHREDFLGLKVWDISNRIVEGDWEAFWKEAETKKNLVYETDLRAKDSRIIPAKAKVSFLKFGEESLICAVVEEMTEKNKHWDDILSLVYDTLDHSMDMFFWFGEEGEIVFYNKTAVEKLGYSDQEFEKINAYDLLKGLPEETTSQYWEMLRRDGYLSFEHLVYRKDGSCFPIEASVIPISYQGQKAACATWRDISERENREKHLKQANKEIERLKEQLEQENQYLQEEVNATHNFKDIISNSEAYNIVLEQVTRVAETNTTVLIQGETGTGKELLARAIHGYSPRKNKPLIKVNCAALPPNLIESELFGHEKGAFTGAHEQKKGRFEIANAATLFLDEIGELPLELQPKLLRVLQEGEFERIGSTTPLKIDVRIIAATNRNLRKLVRAGKFRSDLFYRLNVFPINNLPLRERKEDIPLLVQHFVKKYAEKIGKPVKHVSQRDLNELRRYEFPGNIRELENLIERAIVLSKGDKLNLKAVFSQMNGGPEPKGSRKFLSFEEMQKQHIIKALKRTHWRVTGEKGAAKLLGMNGKTLASKIKKLGIVREDHLVE